jgi:hypothetical protein
VLAAALGAVVVGEVVGAVLVGAVVGAVVVGAALVGAVVVGAALVGAVVGAPLVGDEDDGLVGLVDDVGRDVLGEGWCPRAVLIGLGETTC